MIVELDDKAKKRWIETKGKHLTVTNVEIKGCCSVGIQDLVTIPKKNQRIRIAIMSLK